MKEFLLLHVEKIALALCGALGAYLLYTSIMAEGYDKSAEAFDATTSQARNNVMRSQPTLDDLKSVDFEREAAKLKAPVDPSKYALPIPFRRPIELGMKFREQPQILRPDQVQVLANAGLIPIVEREARTKGDAKVFQALLAQPYPAEMIWYWGNEDLRETLGIVKKPDDNKEGSSGGRRPAPRDRRADARGDESPQAVRSARWVEVVAEFPHVEQLREYIGAVKESAREAGLRYALAEIQRCELTESLEFSEFKTIAWSRQFDLFESAARLDDPSKIAEMPVVPGLVMRVPERALLEREGGRGGGGAPDRFWQMSPSLEPENLRNQTAYEDWKPEELDLKIDKKTAPAPPRRTTTATPATRPSPVGARSTGGAFNNSNDVEFAWMRAWDFTVQPGRRYQYRIRAVVFNPNYKREDVVDPDYSVAELLEGPWSKPSQEIYVEPNTIWYVAEKQTIRPNQVGVTIHAWSDRMANYIPVELPQQTTGQVVGRVGARTVKFATFDPESNKPVVKEETIDGESLNTREILLDVTPGDVRANVSGGAVAIQLPGEDRRNIEWNQAIRPPRDVVVMNEYGDLIRRSELADAGDDERKRREGEYRRVLDLAQRGADGRSSNQPRDGEKGEKGGLLNPLDP
jgi:hypothetical protein